MGWLKRGQSDTAEVDSMTATTSERRDRFEEEFSEWLYKMEEQIESTRESEQLTQEDFAIRINMQHD